ncbi:choice-of-anchor J domain-containing protein [Chitinivorax sp. B]|uniref:choice-of-anchor J domain-containing protein n=1 Tax=Chitinivorax sp. B TaxID=2502235 RepID=UPI0010F6B138|nr:choice-of-anchor J domain-containing protein [Chitinivorax sp. B]
MKAIRTLSAFVLFALAGTASATPLIEGFDNITSLPGAGWSFINNSTDAGSTWFQGNEGIFGAKDGAANSYIAANLTSTNSMLGTISNWLLSPTLSLRGGETLSFLTRTEAGSLNADRLEIRLSKNGNTSQVGNATDSLGDFSLLLSSVNPNLVPDGFPTDWQMFSVVIPDLKGLTDARLGFRYWVTDTGINGSNGNYIGLDNVSVVPTPSSLACLGLGLFGLMASVRRRT